MSDNSVPSHSGSGGSPSVVSISPSGLSPTSAHGGSGYKAAALDPKTSMSEYKQYKAYVPRKWSPFDGDGYSCRSNLSFTQFMPKGEAATQKVLQKAAAEKINASYVFSRERVSEKWTKEMKEYCHQQELQRENDDRSKRLTEALKQRQQLSITRREQAMLPKAMIDPSQIPKGAASTSPSLQRGELLSSSMGSASFIGQEEEDEEEEQWSEAEIQRFQQQMQNLLRVASDMKDAKKRSDHAHQTEALERAREASIVQRLAKVEAQRKAAEERLAEEREEKKEAMEEKLTEAAAKHREAVQAKADTLKQEHEKMLAREKKLVESRRVQEEQDRAKRDRVAQRLREKVEQANQQKEEIAQAAEDILNGRLDRNEERRVLIELMHRTKVDAKEIDRRMESVERKRQDQRQKQLEKLQKAQEAWEKSQARHDEELTEKVESMKEKHQSKQRSVLQRKVELDHRYEEQARESVQRVKGAQSPSGGREGGTAASPSSSMMYRSVGGPTTTSAAMFSSQRIAYEDSIDGSTSTTSPSRLREQRHQKICQEREAKEAERMQQLVEASRAKAVKQQQQLLLQQAAQSERAKEEEEKRKKIFIAATTEQIQKQERAEAAALLKAQKVEKQLEEWRQRRDEELKAKADAENERIAGCLKAVNVDRQIALEEHVEELDKRRAAHQSAVESRRLEEKRQKERETAEQEAARAAQRAALEREKEQLMEEKSRQREERIAHALMHHDQRTHDLSAAYRRKDEQRKDKTLLAATKRVEAFESKDASLQEQYRKKEELRLEKAQEEEEQRAQKAQELHQRVLDANERHFENRLLKLERTGQKLAYVAQRSQTSMDVKRTELAELSRKYLVRSP